VFKPESLNTFDAVCFNNTTGELFEDATLKQALLDFIRGGKGIVGIHAATDCFYNWPEFGALMGGYFDGHPWNETVTVKLDEPGHPVNAAFGGKPFEIADEIYQFKEPYTRHALRVLLRLDTDKTNMTRDGIKRTDKDFAVSWVRNYGLGRLFYCSLGHREEIFCNPAVLGHYLAGIQFALGDLPADATPSARIAADGWTTLFNGQDLSGWINKPGSWVVEDGVLARQGGGDIWTEQLFGDFTLDLEFKFEPEANSGIFFRTGDIKDCVQTGIEMQVIDSFGKPAADKHDCGAIYDCLAPRKNVVKKAGEWNHVTLTCRGPRIQVELNGEAIVDMNLDEWTTAHQNPAGTENKFNTAYKDMPRARPHRLSGPRQVGVVSQYPVEAAGFVGGRRTGCGRARPLRGAAGQRDVAPVFPGFEVVRPRHVHGHSRRRVLVHARPRVDAANDVGMSRRAAIHVRAVAQRLNDGDLRVQHGVRGWAGGAEGLGADAERQRLTHERQQPVAVRGVHGEAVVAFVEQQPVALADELPLEEVHRRRADETRDEAVRGVLVDVVGRRALVEQPVFHHHDAVAQRHGLFLVMRDVDRRRLHLPMQALQFGAHSDAQLRVQVRERLVEQKGLRLPDDRAPDRDALPLPARQGPRPAVEQLLDAEDAGGLLHPAVDLLAFLAGLFPVGVRDEKAEGVVERGVLAAQQQAERHVLIHRHVWVQGVVLEDHGDVAVFRGDAVDDAVADADGAGGDVLEAGDHAQGGALAAAGGADEDDELAIVDLQGDVVDRPHVTGIDLGDAFEMHLGHGRLARYACRAPDISRLVG
jgi:type 1 glutamine amidotransferase